MGGDVDPQGAVVGLVLLVALMVVIELIAWIIRKFKR